MSDVDFEYADLLLHVVEGVSKVAPGLTHLSSAAMTELTAMNTALKDEAAAESKAKVERAQVAPQKTLEPQQPADEPDPNDQPRRL